MEIFLYLLLGALDSLCNFVLMFKIFRFPINEYKYEILLSTIILTFVSYANRMIFNIPDWDMAIQFLLYIVLLMYLFKVNLSYAIDLSSIGYLAFVGIQFTIFPILEFANIVSFNDAHELTGSGTYVIQITSQIICYFVGYLLWKCNFGFSHISKPPHDGFLRYNISGTKTLGLFTNSIAALIVCSTMYWVLNYHAGVYIVLPSVIGALLILFYLSYRKDFGYDRTTVVEVGAMDKKQ
ncbi:hypothetical protein LOZ80_26140 [Paenibacillus sp. HWE-109]|uniref:hypothetical protein n=1 Tax=Paenibacillus sp. HWE-109 TaxID=1306526 RepID=UPI001EDFCC1D|nr:hypothetical protein [Paenibacillus sp. HWE-109]UKS25061.1 hypothetical protein LOZ80_26140 [Paenibacillus sp. HWE-109]